jgi:hypothetical protein
MTDWRDEAQRQLAQAWAAIAILLVSADYLEEALAELDKADARHAEDQAALATLREAYKMQVRSSRNIIEIGIR